MPHSFPLLITLTGALVFSAIFGYFTNRLRLSPIVGYLIAGIAIGRYTPGFVADQHLAGQLAEVGIILLMFSVGLHFHIQDLMKVRRIALTGALAQIAVATGLGMLLSNQFGWDWRAGLVFGLSISVASTVVLTRVLVDNNELHTHTGRVAVGWLVVEDLFTVLALVILPLVLRDAAIDGMTLASDVMAVLVKLLLLGALLFVVGSRVLPWLFEKIAKLKTPELFTLSVLATVLGIAVASAELFHVSMALGAFLAGMVVGRSEFGLRAASEALPMRDAFAVLFFVSVGMLLDPWVLVHYPGFIFSTVTVIVLGKSAVALAIALLCGLPLRSALGVAVALSQVGEFSFILIDLGEKLNVLPKLAVHVLTASAIITISLNPLMYRAVPYIEQFIVKRRRLHRFLTAKLRKSLLEAARVEQPLRLSREHHAVIVGYGPVGQTMNRILKENGIETTIIELNLETVRRLTAEGQRVIYGDASLQNVLEEAQVDKAGTLILASSSVSSPKRLVEIVKDLNPSIRIFGRTSHLHEMKALRDAGVEAVFSGEGEVALALSERILKRLGAPLEQIEREHERVRRELLETP